MLCSPLIINDDLIFPGTYPTDIYYFDIVYILKFEVKFYVIELVLWGKNLPAKISLLCHGEKKYLYN